MNLLKPDSPVMNLLSTIADLIVLHLLFVICCLPIVTVGAAYTAKYYVAMKIIRGEDSGVIIPFFKAFIRNFKQATIVWLTMFVAIVLIIIDWRWIILNGWSNTAFIYKFGVIAFTIFVWLITLTIFPTIARYEMKTSELFKAALIFSIIKFIPLVIISLLIFGTVIACIWYAQWFPLIYFFMTTTITYFLSLVYIRQFDKLEKVQAEKLEAKKAQEESERAAQEAEREELVSDALLDEDATGEASYAKSKIVAKELETKPRKAEEEEDKSGNKLTRYIRSERKKLKGLTLKQKAGYFVQYYLPTTILILLILGIVVWYGVDIYKSKLRVIDGGLINGVVSDEGRLYATKGFLEWGGYGKARTSQLLDTELNFTSDIEFEDKYLEIAFRASVLTGQFDYLIMREDAVDNYSTLDYFMDLNNLLNMENFSEDDFFYYTEEPDTSGGISIDDLLKKKTEEAEGPYPIALKLTDGIEEKLGLDTRYTYYIAFTYSTEANGDKINRQFIEYLYGKC